MPPKRGGGRGRVPIGAPGARAQTIQVPDVPIRGPASATSTVVSTARHVESIGVKRPSYGTSGRAIKVIVNQFELNTDCPRIFHYDGSYFSFPPLGHVTFLTRNLYLLFHSWYVESTH